MGQDPSFKYVKFPGSMQTNNFQSNDKPPYIVIEELGFKNMSVLQNDVRSTSRYVKILMDSNASASIINNSFVRANKFNTRKTSANKWSTMAGSFLMSCEAEAKVKLPKLNVTAHIIAPFHVTSQKSNYNVIFGQTYYGNLE